MRMGKIMVFSILHSIACTYACIQHTQYHQFIIHMIELAAIIGQTQGCCQLSKLNSWWHVHNTLNSNMLWSWMWYSEWAQPSYSLVHLSMQSYFVKAFGKVQCEWFLPQIGIAIEAVILQTSWVCYISHLKLTPRWSFISVNFIPGV